MFFLLGKEDCELCDQAKAVVDSIGILAELNELDILKNSFLESRYGWHIPVVVYMDSGNRDIADTNETVVAQYLQSGLTAKEPTSNKPGEEIQPLYDSSHRTIELFWPFPPSRARQFIQQFVTL